MKIYQVGVITAGTFTQSTQGYRRMPEEHKKIIDDLLYFLESYYYLKDSHINNTRKEGKKIFLDSGAFSAHSLGKDIDIDDYTKFVHDNIDIIEKVNNQYLFSVLDGIGDPKLTLINQRDMESNGLEPLPCFHFGEDIKYLKYYLKNYEYITLGGMVGKSKKRLIPWLDNLWANYLIHSEAKIHAFGITAVSLMARYPWFSVDSSTAIMTSAYGAVLHPKLGSFPISDRSPQRFIKNSHFDTYKPETKKKLKKYIKKSGLSEEELRSKGRSRTLFNFWVQNEVTKRTHNGKKNTDFNLPTQELLFNEY